MSFIKVTRASGATCMINTDFISYIIFDADPQHNTIIYLRNGESITVQEQSIAYFADALDIKP